MVSQMQGWVGGKRRGLDIAGSRTGRNIVLSMGYGAGAGPRAGVAGIVGVMLRGHESHGRLSSLVVGVNNRRLSVSLPCRR